MTEAIFKLSAAATSLIITGPDLLVSTAWLRLESYAAMPDDTADRWLELYLKIQEAPQRARDVIRRCNLD